MKKSLIKVVTASTILLLAGCAQSNSNQPANSGNANQPANTANASGEVIATVGDESISFDEFYAKLKAQAGSATLRSMIIEKILTQNVADKDALKKAADDEVNAQIESAGGEQVFEQLLAYQNLGSVADFRNSVYVRNLFQEVIKNNVDLSEEAIKAYYESGYSPTMEAQHILVDTEEEAQAVLDRLAAGEEFDALAQELSKDSSAANGGLLGEFKAGQMVAEFEEAVRSVANGELVDHPVKSQFGYHVIRTIKNGEKKPYDEVAEEVKEAYLQTKYNDSSVAYSIVGKFIREKGVEIKDADLKSALDELMTAVESAEASANATQTTTVEESSNTEETTVEEEITEAAAEETEEVVEETTAE